MQTIHKYQELYNFLPEGDFKNLVGRIAESVQVYHDMVLVNLFGGVAAAVNGKFEVMVNKTWVEPVTFYFMVVANSAERKSSIVKIAKDPHKKWLSIKTDQHKKAIIKAKNKKIIINNKIKKLRNKASNLDDLTSPEHDKLLDEIIDLEESLPKLPLENRLFFENITLSALKRVLAAYNGRICHFEPEGGIFDILKNKNCNVSLFCNAYDGEDGSIDRVHEIPLKIPNPSIQLCVSIQEGLIMDVLRNKKPIDGGLMGRFLSVYLPSLAGYRSTTTLSVPEEDLKFYEQKIHSLLDLPFQNNDHKEGKAWQLELNYEAQIQFNSFNDYAEKAKLNGGELSFSTSWGGKFIGKVLRLSGLLHCIKHDDPKSSKIDKETIIQAFSIGQIFTQHTVNLYFYASYGKNIEAGEAILTWIQQQIPMTSFTATDAYNNTDGFNRKSIQNGINALIRDGIIQEDFNAYAQQQAKGVKGRNKKLYTLVLRPLLYIPGNQPGIL